MATKTGFLSKKDFAFKCGGKKTGWLSVYEKRGKVVYDAATGMIDPKHPLNKLFLEQYGSTVFGGAAAVREEPKKKPARAVRLSEVDADDEQDNDYNFDDGDDDDGPLGGRGTFTFGGGGMHTANGYIPPYAESEAKYKHWQAIKEERAGVKLALEIEKKQGEVVPVEPIETLVFRFQQEVMTQMKQLCERNLTEMAHKYNMTPEDVAAYRGKYIAGINNAATQASKNFTEDMGKTLNEFTTKRGVGERNT